MIFQILMVFLAGLSVTAAAEKNKGDGTLAFVDTGEKIYVRAEPTTDSAPVAVLDDHASVRMYETTEDGWVAIKSGEAAGYVRLERLATGKRAKKIAKEEGQEVGIVYPEALNIRVEPVSGADSLQLVYKDEDLTILSHEGEWLKVRSAAGTEGYVHSMYCNYKTIYDVARVIDAVEESLEEEEWEDPTFECQSWRAPRDEEISWIEQMERETKEAVEEEIDTEIPYVEEAYEEDGVLDAVFYEEPEDIWEPEPEYIWEPEPEYIWEPEPEPEYIWEPEPEYTWQPDYSTQERGENVYGENIAGAAQQYLGNPYIWGGVDPVNGSDCSGLTQYVYGSYGIQIPRVAQDQYTLGYEISLDQVQEGDLIFYDNEWDGEMDHVGIYIGDGKILHNASPETGVIISDMYYRYPAGAVYYN